MIFSRRLVSCLYTSGNLYHIVIPSPWPHQLPTFGAFKFEKKQNVLYRWSDIQRYFDFFPRNFWCWAVFLFSNWKCWVIFWCEFDFMTWYVWMLPVLRSVRGSLGMQERKIKGLERGQAATHVEFQPVYYVARITGN